MSRSTTQSSLKRALLAAALFAAAPALAAEVTPERLANADKEPQNWLMNHRTYDAQRFSPLARINKDNVKSLKLAYAVALGGTAIGENLQATPLVEDGFMYVVDLWGIVYKIDVRSGDAGRIVWRMDPKQEKFPLANRGAALWGNLVISVASYPARVIATNKETGKVEWETNIDDKQVDLQITAAPLAVRDKVIVGAAGGDRGVRDFIAGLDAKTGKLAWRKYVVPAPGEPGSETWKDTHNAWQTGGGAMWVTGSYDVATNQVIWGTGNPVPMFDPTYRPGDNQHDLVGSRQRQDELVLPVSARRHVGLRRGRQPHSDRRRHQRAEAHIGDPFGPQRLSLYVRAQHRPAGPGQALHGQDQLDQGDRSEDRQAGGL
jgi:alcohol dehydrogenase (cytochrome c)